MKILWSFGLWAALVTGTAIAAQDSLSDQAKRSYAVGANVGKTLKRQNLDLDPGMIAKGLLETMAGNSRLSDDEVMAVLQQLREEAKQIQATERQQAAEENQRRGAAFLAEYAKRDGVAALPGGVLYRVLHAGSGEKLNGAEFVFCHFRGSLVNGAEFDASAPGRPSVFPLDKIITGFREAVLEMPVGSKWEVVIPAEKAYGGIGKAPAIGPNETLLFEVELVGGE